MRHYGIALLTCVAALTVVPRLAEGQGYWWSPYEHSYSSTLPEGIGRGMADVIRAGGEAARNQAEALVKYEEARTRYIDNRQKWLAIRQRNKRLGLALRYERAARAREARQRYHDLQASLPRPTLTPDQLDLVTGRVEWPDLLRAPDYSDERRALEEQFVLLGHTGAMTGASDAEDAIRRLQSELKRSIRDVRPQEYIESKSFLDALFYFVRTSPAATPDGSPKAVSTVPVEDVPQLIEKLSTSDLAERHETIVTLGQLGPAAAPAVAALINALSEESIIIRHSALEALASIGVDPEVGVPAAKRFLNDPDPLIEVAAARYLAVHEKDESTVRSAVSTLVAALASENAHVRSEAAAGLSEAGAAAVGAANSVFESQNPVVLRKRRSRWRGLESMRGRRFRLSSMP